MPEQEDLSAVSSMMWGFLQKLLSFPGQNLQPEVILGEPPFFSLFSANV
jgi:hypothetical protein